MSLQDASYEIIDDIGKDVTLTKVTQGTYTPGTGVTNTTSTETVKAMILNYQNGQIDGSLILSNDRKIVVAAKDATAPQVDDTITDGSDVYRIVNIHKVEENTNAVIYTCQGRQQ